MLTPEVAEAIQEIKESFPNATVEAHEDGDGGGFVIVDPVETGASFTQEDTWIGFHISFQYPVADCYPHFVRADLTRKDGQPLGEAMSASRFAFDNRLAVQISRRSNRLNPATDTAELKLWKVLEWLRSR